MYLAFFVEKARSINTPRGFPKTLTMLRCPEKTSRHSLSHSSFTSMSLEHILAASLWCFPSELIGIVASFVLEVRHVAEMAMAQDERPLAESCVAISPDTTLVASTFSNSDSGDDGSMKLWDRTAQSCIPLQQAESIYALKFSGNGKLLFAASRSAIYTYSISRAAHAVTTCSLASTVPLSPTQRQPTGHIAFSPASDWVVVANTQLAAYDTLGKRQWAKSHDFWPTAAHTATALSFSDCGRYVLAGSNLGCIRVFNEDGKLWKEYEIPRTKPSSSNYVYDVRLSTDCKFIATCSEDEGVDLWPTNDSRPICKLCVAQKRLPISSVCFTPDSRFLIVGGVVLYSVAKHDMVTSIRHPKCGDNAGRTYFAPNSALFVSSYHGVYLTLWKLDPMYASVKGRLRAEMQEPTPKRQRTDAVLLCTLP
jgi:WD40 repeat protein